MSRSSWFRNKACGIDSTYGTSLILFRMSTTDAYSTHDLSVDILYQYAAGDHHAPFRYTGERHEEGRRLLGALC